MDTSSTTDHYKTEQPILPRDEENLFLASSPNVVDQINADFYGRFPYPWQPMKLDRSLDSSFEAAMVCQAIGDWTHERIRPNCKIWVAGCGTNQAAITSLLFPDALVVGSDLSQPSLDLCAKTAASVGVTNLDLRRESLNEVGYVEEFDFILSTGVIHHNQDPAATLKKIARALKPSGVLELMVYNRFHRIPLAAFQRAMRMLARGDKPGGDLELSLLDPVIRALPEGLMARELRARDSMPRSAFADNFLQPVESSYTMESLNTLVNECGLEILQPTVSSFDKARGTYLWNLASNDATLKQHLYGLSDIERWQVTNLLALDRSPSLWIYLQRTDSPIRRKSEQEICESFLKTPFDRAAANRQGYVNNNGSYNAVGTTTPYPGLVQGERLRRVVDSVHRAEPIESLLKREGLPSQWPEANETRIQLTTPAFPYLRAHQ